MQTVSSTMPIASATRTVEFSIKDGLNYKVKIPTNDELATYVGGAWNTTQANYDSNNPLINQLFVKQLCT